MDRTPAAWQKPVTHFLAILSYHHFLGCLGLEKHSNVSSKPFPKNNEWSRIITSCFHCNYFTGKT